MEDDNWKEPSEEELKIIKANRERSEKISHVMGQYLLKGYRMLGSCCETCGTILLQDKQQELYCVSCSEIDKDTTKDKLALSGEVANKQELNHDTTSKPKSVVGSRKSTVKEPLLPDRTKSSMADEELLSKSEESVKDTLLWAVTLLDSCRSVDTCIQYCNLVKSCADALVSLKNVKGPI